MKFVIIVVIVIAIFGLGFFVLSRKNKPPVSNNTNPTEIPERSPMSSETSMKQYKEPPVMMIDAQKTYTATFKTTKGEMVIPLFPTESPIAVNNFVFLAKEGFYTNTPFHRVISGFMIQSGDPTGTGTGGPGYKFADEPIKKDYTRGTLAMANAGPNTNGSQFFIMHKDNTSLPKNYVIFGQIDSSDSKSLATLDALLATPVTMSTSGEMSKPTDDIRLTQITITEK